MIRQVNKSAGDDELSERERKIAEEMAEALYKILDRETDPGGALIKMSAASRVVAASITMAFSGISNPGMLLKTSIQLSMDMQAEIIDVISMMFDEVINTGGLGDELHGREFSGEEMVDKIAHMVDHDAEVIALAKALAKAKELCATVQDRRKQTH